MPKQSLHSSRLASLLFVIGRRMRDGGGHGKARKGLSLLHFETLRYIRANGRPLMRDLAAHLLITPPAATLLVDGLVRHRFIARVFDPKDRRAVRVVVTRKGKLLFERQIRKKMQEIKKVFSVLTPKEQVALAEILEKVAKKKA